MGSKGYVVRGKHRSEYAAISDVDGTSTGDRKPNPFATINEAVTRMVWLGPFGWSDVAIFRVHADGREERLPGYEEALGELVRLRDQHIADRAEMAGAMAEMKKCARALDEAIEAHARKDAEIERLRAGLLDAAGQSRRLGAVIADPLAALEAAERRLLEAGGWRLNTLAAGFGVERWARGHDVESRTVAMTIERRRLAAKGGA